MKLLVFAHTPPPHHGQSYMVQLMLEGFGGDRRRQKPGAAAPSPYGIECYHVNARLSQKLEDIGDFRIGKLILLLGYCFQAIWCRFRYGVRTFYYIPAPGKPSALYRDWLVMFVCRPFFSRVVLHWHAAGLAKWLETCVQKRIRSLTYRFMRKVDLSIVLSRYNRADAEKLFSRNVKVVGNGIPDPCPEFERTVLPRRRARLAARRKLAAGLPLDAADQAAAGGNPHVFRVLYLAHCTREKGLFDALAGVLAAHRKLVESRSPISLQLLVAGTFVANHEKAEFDRLLAQPDAGSITQYLGFVAGDRRINCFAKPICFVFQPTIKTKTSR